MLEVELKILEIDKDKIINKLITLGAEKIFEGEIFCEAYINHENKKIRIRRKGEKNYIDYKVNLEQGSIRVNDEFETEFEDLEVMRTILHSIGFTKYSANQKRRISYKYKDTRFEFDKYDGIPWYLEIESNSKDKVEQAVLMLGYTMEDTCPLTVRQLREFYETKK